MKRNYLVLTIIGTILPNIFVLRESLESGNILLYARPMDTFAGMFANNISAAFITDLLFIVLLFLGWTIWEAPRIKLKKLWLIWLYTFALGIAGGLPLYLYCREGIKERDTKN